MKLRKVLASAMAVVMAASALLVAPVEANAAEAAEKQTLADIQSGLVGYYTFDETLANGATENGAAKLHGGAGDTWEAEATGTAAYAEGKVGKAYSFTGDVGAVRGEGLELDIKLPEAYTISFWANPTTVTSATSMVFVPDTVDKGINIADNWFGTTFPTVRIWGWGAAGTNDAYLDNWLPDPDGDGADVAEDDDACGKWYYITLTSDETGALVLYIDGEEVATGKHAAGAFKDMSMFLGINFWDPSFHGLMDEVTVYDRALAAADVAALYATNGVPTGTVSTTAITLSEKSKNMVVGDTYTLSVTGYEPEAVTVLPTISWTSSDETVATVEDGVVTAVKAGEATITASVSDTVKATCTVTITDEVKPLTAIDVTANKTEIELDETANLTVAYNPEDTTDDKAVTWTSSDEKVVTVKDGVVTAVGYGKATITAKVGELTDAVEITVLERPATAIDVKVDKTNLQVGESATITTTVTPEDTTDVVTYESSDGSIITVDATGKVTAIKAGTAKVTVKAGDISKEISFAVNETTEMKLDDLNCDGWWTAHTAGVNIESGKTYTFTFKAKSTDNASNWFCPIYVVYTDKEARVNATTTDYAEYLVARADVWAWSPNGDRDTGLGDGYKFEINKMPADEAGWTDFRSAINAGASGKITAKLSGKNLVVTYTIAGAESKATIPVDTSKPVYISLSGEKCNLSNIVVTAKTSNAAKDPWGDINMVLPVAFVLFGGAVVLVASKKRFA